jgi:hypothetical protein
MIFRPIPDEGRIPLIQYFDKGVAASGCEPRQEGPPLRFAPAAIEAASVIPDWTPKRKSTVVMDLSQTISKR